MVVLHYKCPKCPERWQLSSDGVNKELFDLEEVLVRVSVIEHCIEHDSKDQEKDLTYHYDI